MCKVTLLSLAVLSFLNSPEGQKTFGNDYKFIPEKRVKLAAQACVEQFNDPELNPELCMAISLQESRFNPLAVGPKLKSGRRAQGMMQTIIKWAPKYGVYTENVHTYKGSVQYGYWMLYHWRKVEGKDFLCRYAGGNNHCARPYANLVYSIANHIKRHETLLTVECEPPKVIE